MLGLEGGASAEPIQRTRYLDPLFEGDSTGSVTAPYSSFAPFLAEVADTSHAWELWLPAMSKSTP